MTQLNIFVFFFCFFFFFFFFCLCVFLGSSVLLKAWHTHFRLE